VRALVIGGSLGGLIAAHLMRSIGWDVAVFERNAEELASRGVGLGTHQQLIQILQRIGIAFDASMGIRVEDVICLDRHGRIVLQRPTARTMTGWGRLYHALREALPASSYRLSMNLRHVEQDGEGVTAVFADGSRERGDILIGADGMRSSIRQQFSSHTQPLYAGYVAWRAMLDERDVPDRSCEIFERYSFCLPQGEQLLGYPVPGRNNDTAVGRRAYNIVWYRPTEPDRDLVDLLTDADGRHHAGGIPPPMIRPEAVAAIKATAQALIAPQIADIFLRARPFFQPIYDLESARIAFGRVVLLGDAAFVARPHVGAGTTKAAIDAASLAGSLRAAGDDIAAALADYQRKQRAFGREMVELGREHGAYLSAQLKPREQRTAAELHQDVGEMFDKHFARSEQVRRIVNQLGLAPS
jgi:2-polyprenyl-6-methoxyphenol hydroxylase-like FAD-dependent oxidoreductase